MGYLEAARGYLLAYNTKVALQADPIMEPGVIDAEKAKFTGTVNMSLVGEYDRLVLEINTGIPAKIAEQEALMTQYKPDIITFFAEMEGQGLEFLLSDDGTQKISVEAGEVVIT